MKPRILLTVEEAAESIGIGRTTMFTFLKQGEVESVLVGRLRRVPVTAIEDYLSRLAAEQHGSTEAEA